MMSWSISGADDAPNISRLEHHRPVCVCISSMVGMGHSRTMASFDLGISTHSLTSFMLLCTTTKSDTHRVGPSTLSIISISSSCFSFSSTCILTLNGILPTVCATGLILVYMELQLKIFEFDLKTFFVLLLQCRLHVCPLSGLYLCVLWVLCGGAPMSLLSSSLAHTSVRSSLAHRL